MPRNNLTQVTYNGQNPNPSGSLAAESAVGKLVANRQVFLPQPDSVIVLQSPETLFCIQIGLHLGLIFLTNHSFLELNPPPGLLLCLRRICGPVDLLTHVVSQLMV